VRRECQACVARPYGYIGGTLGVMARKWDERFVITSDHNPDGAANQRAPRNLSDTYFVRTGESLSSVMTDTEIFDTMEAAEGYMRVNYERVMKYG
jgi:hypothetical protein